MVNFFKKTWQTGKIISSKQIIKTRASEIAEKMEKLVDHLQILKDEKSDTIYLKNRNIIINLFEYYCEYIKLYIDLTFSEVLIPVDTQTIRNIDIKKFVAQLREKYKVNYETTVANFKDEDKPILENIYNKLMSDIDGTIRLLIEIQSNIIINEISPIHESVILEKINNTLVFDIINKNYVSIEDNYLKYLNELNASKKIFKPSTAL